MLFRSRTPAQLKSLLIQQLVKHSLDEDFPPAQRVKCLELMGKLYEVGAFEERKITTVIHESSKVKERLLSQLKTVINGKGLVNDIDEGDSLLAELTKAEQGPGESGEDQQPTHLAPPQTGPSDGGLATHTIPHNESAVETFCQNTPDNSLIDKDKKMSLVQCTSENGEKEEGGGGKNPVEVELGKDIEMTPLDDMDKK